MLSPVVDEIAEETAGVKVGKINVDEEPERPCSSGVFQHSTLVVMKDGRWRPARGRAAQGFHSEDDRP